MLIKRFRRKRVRLIILNSLEPVLQNEVYSGYSVALFMQCNEWNALKILRKLTKNIYQNSGPWALELPLMTGLNCSLSCKISSGSQLQNKHTQLKIACSFAWQETLETCIVRVHLSVHFQYEPFNIWHYMGFVRALEDRLH